MTQTVTDIKSNLFFMITQYWWTKHNSWSTNHTMRSTKYTQPYTFRLNMVSLFNKKGENYPSAWTSPLFNGILWQSCSQNSLTDKHMPFFQNLFTVQNKHLFACCLAHHLARCASRNSSSRHTVRFSKLRQQKRVQLLFSVFNTLTSFQFTL